ncbi:MAG TPA: phenylalanine--tRNA ligase subunit alpha [Candidatus Hydrogenedentes bacterium]|nr:phenylalanine--tRNA ligase subunit alpha [Candidatus Hydrogenedentota bacterium]HIJ72544.1 phenylalanine--tRNA ligase subunit alpha [Candidatus Hydrogenedentota bacterium]
MQDRLKRMQAEGIAEIAQAPDTRALDDIRVALLGRKGALTEILRGLGTAPPDQRPAIGKAANAVKKALEEAIDARKTVLETQVARREARETAVDMSLPGRRPMRGHMHLVPQVAEEILGIFLELGFQAATGPDVETEYYNFDSLNTPPDHPARDLHDTFFVKPGVVLRSHTSPVQMRVMEKHAPPVAVVVPGRVYRNDYDASHSPMFYQIEGLLVDKGVSFADLKGTLLLFIHRFFGPDTEMRFRPHFFPFTEPSAEVDISCSVCKGEGCRLCKNTGWLEILGCGMVHPVVFGYAGYDCETYTGYAFGLGIDRIAMLRHAIDNIHHLYENDLRFLEQF